MKNLTVVPYAGLCNRLNSIVCALQYKTKHPNVDVKIFWFKYFHCNCRFDDLFKQLPPPYPHVQELGFGVKNRPGTKFNFYIPDKLRFLWYDCVITPSHNADRFEDYTKEKERVYVYKDNRFCFAEPDYNVSRFFQPVDDIQKRINEVTKDWNGNVIGLHIRRTDNTLAIKNTPIEHFYNIIDKELSIDKNAKFYLATDDDYVKIELKKRYGEHTIISPKLTLKRNSVRGMKDAVLDLFCLASTKKIYGSCASTYSLFASHLFGRELITKV